MYDFFLTFAPRNIFFKYNYENKHFFRFSTTDMQLFFARKMRMAKHGN